MLLRLVAKILKVLNSEGEPWQIAMALALGMVAGLTPLLSIHNLIILFLVLIIRVNLSSFLGGLAVFSGLAYVFDPVFHRIGMTILKADGFQTLWTGLYQSPFWRITRFNNSIVMGSLAVSLAAFIPMVFLLRLLIKKYRDHLLVWVRKTKLMQGIMASKLYFLYQKVSGW